MFLKEIASVLHLNVNDVSRIVPRTSDLETSSRDGTGSMSSMEIPSFLGAFDLSSSHTDADDCIRIKTSISVAHRSSLSSWIWGTTFARSIDLLDELHCVLKDSLIAPHDLVCLLISHWLEQLAAPALSKMLHLHKILRFLCYIAGNSNIYPSKMYI